MTFSIYVDAVINHMAAGGNRGTAGTQIELALQ
jgi:hypothetical protein